MSYQRPAKRSKTSGESEAQSSNEGSGNTIDVMPESIANSYVIPSMCVKFDISSSGLCAAGGKTLAAGLKGNQVLTELNIANNSLGLVKKYGNVDMSGVIAICDIIPTMGALEKLLMGNNSMLTKEAGKALAGALATNSTLKKLDVSSNNWREYGHTGKWMGDGPGFAKELTDGIKNNRAIVTVNIMANKIGKEQLSKLQEIMQAHPTLVSLCGIADDATEANLSGLGMDTDDAVILANELPAKGALTSLNISNNSIVSESSNIEADASNSKVGDLVEYQGAQRPISYITKKGYLVLMLDGIVAISSAIPNMGALVKFDISNNSLGPEGGKVLGDSLKNNTVMTELDISSNYLRLDESTTSLVDGMVDGMVEEHKLQHDLSGVNAISNAMSTMGALAKFSISCNYLRAEGGKALAAGLKGSKNITELDISDNYLGNNSSWRDDIDMSGVIAISDAIPTMGALTSLNISGNTIGELVEVEKLPPAGWSKEPAGVIVVADAIKNSGAIAKLRMARNMINGAEAGKAIGCMLANNTVLKELDLSEQGDYYSDFCEYALDSACAKELAVGLSTNGAISYDIVTHESLVAFHQEHDPELVGQEEHFLRDCTTKDLLTECEETYGSVPKVTVVPKAKGALVTVNIMCNHIGIEQANEFIKIMESHSNLKTLCGFSGDETLLDLSNKNLGAGCGVLVANEVKNNRELMILDIRENHYIREMVLPKGWSHSYRMDDRNGPYKHTDGRKQKEHPGKPEDIIALTQSMKYMLTECALNKRQWPFMKSNAFMKKDIDTLAEALCMNALPSRKNMSCSNERHPLRKPWLLRKMVDYLWGEF